MLRNVAGALLIYLTAACGDDAGGSPDAAPPDAAAPDAPPPPLRRAYVLDRVTLPGENRPDVEIDVDGDGLRENRLGSLLATLETQSGGDQDALLVRQGDVDRAIDRGDLITLLDLVSPTFREGVVVAATIVDGADPVPAPCTGAQDATCRRHLAGDGRFAIADGASPGALAGAVIAGDIEASGAITLRLPFASGAVVDIPLVSARLEVHDVTTGVAGFLGGGIRQADVRAVLIPELAAWTRTMIAADCVLVPDEGGADACGCPSGTGRTLLGVFDSDADCMLADAEIAQSPFFRTVLEPDLDLEPPAQYNDSLSFAVGIGAVPATWSAAP
jgi:hypothetical protein